MPITLCKDCWDEKRSEEHECKKENVKTYMVEVIDEIFEDLTETGFHREHILIAIQRACKNWIK